MSFLFRWCFQTHPDSQKTICRQLQELPCSVRACMSVWHHRFGLDGGSGARCSLIQMELSSVSSKYHIPKLTFIGISLPDYRRLSLNFLKPGFHQNFELSNNHLTLLIREINMVATYIYWHHCCHLQVTPWSHMQVKILVLWSLVSSYLFSIFILHCIMKSQIMHVFHITW